MISKDYYELYEHYKGMASAALDRGDLVGAQWFLSKANKYGAKHYFESLREVNQQFEKYKSRVES